MRVARLGPTAPCVGPRGKNAASDRAEDSRVRWNGIGCEMQNIREAGTYSFVTMAWAAGDFARISDS